MQAVEDWAASLGDYTERVDEMSKSEQLDAILIEEERNMGANELIIQAWTKLLTLDRDRRGQGTVEYVILVGVLVVIAIIAVAAFSGKIQELWDSITEAINALD
jgi:Flp pilus assembly pilin Flp